MPGKRARNSPSRHSPSEVMNFIDGAGVRWALVDTGNPNNRAVVAEVSPERRHCWRRPAERNPCRRRPIRRPYPNAQGNSGSQANIHLVKSAIRGILANCTIDRFRSLSRLPDSNPTSSVSCQVTTNLIRSIAYRCEKTLRGTIQNWRDIFRISPPIRVFLTACPRRWRVAR